MLKKLNSVLLKHKKYIFIELTNRLLIANKVFLLKFISTKCQCGAAYLKNII